MRVGVLLAATATAIASAAVLPAPPSLLVLNPTSPSQATNVTLTASSLLRQPPTTSNLTLPLSTLNLPDDRFKVKISQGGNFVAVDSTLIGALYLMSIVGSQTFTQKLAPRYYSTPFYRDVVIQNLAWTESRFLLWGVYFGVYYMTAYARFHEATLELYYDNAVVGKVKIVAVKRGALAGDDAEATPDLVSSAAASNNASVATGLSIPSDYSIDYENVPGARAVGRNDLFLTFYDAMIHVAQFPVGGLMRDFQSESPEGRVTLKMEERELGCQYSVVIDALYNVPKYMMEHKDFGYKESKFVIRSRNDVICEGTIAKPLLSVG